MSDDILSEWDNFDLDEDGEVIKVNNIVNKADGVVNDTPFADYADIESVVENTGILVQDGIQYASNGEVILQDNTPDSLCPPLECKDNTELMPEFREIPDLCYCPPVVEMQPLGTKTVVVTKFTDNLEYSINEFLTKKNCEG